MGSIDRRLESLERLARPVEEAGDAHRRQLVREFLGRALDALAHVKRSRIDHEQWRYSVERLSDESPATVAAYLCALRDQGHEDEARAREILELEQKVSEAEGVDLATLEKLMDAFAALASRATAEHG